MLSRVQYVMLVAIAALLAISAALAMLPMLPSRWFEAPPEPPRPLALELFEPRGTPVTRPTRGMTVGGGGFGTILSAPGRRLVPSPSPPPAGDPLLAAEPPLAPEVAGLVRLMARLAPRPPSDRLVTFDLEEPAPQFGTIILRDGCLRLAGPGEPHAILPAGTRLYVDEEGFLTAGVLVNGMATNPRIGEPAWWPGGSRLEADPAALARISAKCGPGGFRILGPVQSLAASQAAADGAAARAVANMYGIEWATALARVRDCRARLARNEGIDPARMIHNPCGSTPPSPVADPRACPEGTTHRGGLCRTPAGYVRPVPPV